MSRENVEVVQTASEAINNGDDERLLGLTASDIEIEASDLLLDQGTFRGHDGAREYAESLREVWGNSLRIHAEDFIEHRDCVVVMARTSARGKTSGAEVEIPLAHIWTIRAGEVVRFQVFGSREEALEAAGLSE
jgi:uncharacterized protein